MTMYFRSTINTESATYPTAAHTVDDIKLLRDSYWMVMLDGHHRCHSIEMLQKKDGVECFAEPLHMHYGFRVGGKATSPAEGVNLRKITNLSTAIVQREPMFPDTMQSLLSYVQAFEENYGVHFLHMRISDIMENIIYSNFLPTKSRATSKRYIGVDKMMRKNRGVLPLL